MSRRRLTALGAAALLVLPLAACENTMEGIQEDTERNVEQIDEEIGD
jgi:predicted small secreted protein